MKIKKYTKIAMIVLLLNCLTCISFAQNTGDTVANITFLQGTLDLAEMQSFTFGEYTISASVQDYTADEALVFLDVYDMRGTGYGWKVTAVASPFMSGEEDTLPGASIYFTNGTADTTGLNINEPSVYQNIRLDCDGESSADIAQAAVNHGLGHWRVNWSGTQWNNTNAVLKLPIGSATIGTHTATITWTLANAP